MEEGTALGPIGTPVSRTDLLVAAIKRAILDGTLPPGGPLSEREVAARFGVSKTPVRDAFRLLRSTGLIEISSFQRVTVRNVDAALVRELYQARRLVEPAAIRLAIQTRGSQPLPAARSALTQADEATAAADMAALSIANRRFHRELYLPCPNRFLREQLDQFQDLTALVATVGWRRQPTNRQEGAEHAAVLEAYEAGDPDTAAQRMHDHITNATNHLLNIITD